MERQYSQRQLKSPYKRSALDRIPFMAIAIAIVLVNAHNQVMETQRRMTEGFKEIKEAVQECGKDERPLILPEPIDRLPPITTEDTSIAKCNKPDCLVLHQSGDLIEYHPH